MKILLSSKRHHYVAIVSIFLIIVAFIAGTVSCSCDHGGGDGDVDGVEIQNWYDLDAVRNNLVGSYVLMKDLDDTTDGYDELVGETVDGKGWEPIGTLANPFEGTFDGQGNEISDLFIYRPDEDEVGLFGRVSEGGLIKNVGLVSVNVTGKKSVGALVGYNRNSTLDSDVRPPGAKTYSNGSVTGEEDVGGLVGNNYDGIVNQCESSAHVFHVSNAPDEESWRAGGLVGLNSGTVLNCNYNGAVNGDRQVGGLVGLNEYIPLTSLRGRVEGCSGAYCVHGNLEIGGLAGRNMGILVRCPPFSGLVSGIPTVECLVELNEGATGNALSSDTALPGSYVGGVAGVNEYIVEDCSAEATVEGYWYVGGLVGDNKEGGVVSESHFGGSVTGEDYVGGLVGRNAIGGTVSNSDSSAKVEGTGIHVNDLIGRDESVRYNLHMAADPVAGGDAIDVAAKGAYAAGVSVSIKAVPAAGYWFVNWTAAPAVVFDNANSVETTFTMLPQDVTVTAHFVIVGPLVGPLDHFNCYLAADERGEGEWGVISVEEVVYLEDQFGAVQAEVGYAGWFCSPVEKWHDGVTPISNPDHHLTIYSLDYEEELQTWVVWVDNQFGTEQQLTVSGPTGLAVPTQKEGHEPPVGLDHFLFYNVIEGPYVEAVVGLDDQFGDQPQVLVTAPVGFAIPVQKTHDGEVTEIVNPEAHLVFYQIEGEEIETKVQVVNQFGAQTLDMGGPYLLAVPSEKLYCIS